MSPSRRMLGITSEICIRAESSWVWPVMQDRRRVALRFLGVVLALFVSLAFLIRRLKASIRSSDPEVVGSARVSTTATVPKSAAPREAVSEPERSSNEPDEPQAPDLLLRPEEGEQEGRQACL